MEDKSLCFVCALDVGDDIALAHLGPLLGIDFNQLAAEGGRNGDELAPGSLDVTEDITLLVFLSDVRLDCRGSFAVALELPEELSLDRCDDGVGLGMLEGCRLLRADLGTELGILGGLQVGKEVLLGLSV